MQHFVLFPLNPIEMKVVAVNKAKNLKGDDSFVNVLDCSLLYLTPGLFFLCVKTSPQTIDSYPHTLYSFTPLT